ncbi:MAG TPA: L-rhamnose mutarotase [Microterricola sp.]
MIVALHSEIRAGAVDGYRAAHLTVPEELVASFDRFGIHDWTIWRSGHRLFHLVDCDDFDAALAALDEDPANARWQLDIGRYVELFRGADGEEGFSPLEQVWALSAQKSGAHKATTRKPGA